MLAIGMDPTAYATVAIIVAALSEALSLYPGVRANGVIQLVMQILRVVFPRR